MAEYEPVPGQGISYGPPQIEWGADGRSVLRGADRIEFPSNGQTIYVAPPGSYGYYDETSIAAAVARATARVLSTGLPAVVVVAAGQYVEANPVAVPPGVIVYGRSTLTVRVVAANAAAPVFALAPGATLRDLTIAGAAVGVAYSGATYPGFGTAQNLALTGVGVGILNAAGPAPLFVNECAFLASPTAPVGSGLRTAAGATSHVTVCYSGAAAGSAIGVVVEAVGAGAIVNLIGGGFGGAAVCFSASAGGLLAVNGAIVRECVTACAVGAAAFQAAGLVVERCGTDVRVTDAAADVRLTFCTLDQNKVSNSPGAEFRGVVYSAAETATQVFGELQVGTPGRPRATALGGGDASAWGLRVLAGPADAGAEAGACAAVDGAGLEGGAPFGFASAAADACLYIGSYFEHVGLELDVAAAAGAALEVHDGLGWVPLAAMVTDAAPPHALRPARADGAGGVTFRVATAAGAEDVRYAVAAWDKRTISGVEAYWVRLRNVGGHSGAFLRQVQLHASHAAFAPDGSASAFGAAAPARVVPWRVAGELAAGGALAAAGRLPAGVDVSRPLRVTLLCEAPAAGVVDWEVGHASAAAAAVAGAPLEAAAYATTVAAAGLFEAGPFELDASGHAARPRAGDPATPPDLLRVVVARPAGGAVGPVTVLEARLEYHEAFAS